MSELDAACCIRASRVNAKEPITLALVLNGAGMSPFNIHIMLEHMNVKVHVDTITIWLEHYVALVEKYTDSIQPPNLGSKLGAEGKRQDVEGEENYFVMGMDLTTRFILDGRPRRAR